MHKYKLILSSIILVNAINACSSSNTINSSWMADNKKTLASKKLTTITIPGSHYSNAYGINNEDQSKLTVCNGEVSNTPLSVEAQLAQLTSSSPLVASKTDLINYLNTQSNSIQSQLDNGVRYLELKICIQDANYYTSNYYLTETLDAIFTQVLNFMATNSDEIIFIDLDNNFYTDYGKLSSNDLNIFHNYLQTRFGSFLMPKKNWQQLTFNDIWSTKHRLIILSSNPMLTKYYDIWDKNEVMNTPPEAEYTTIKKLNMIQQTVRDESQNLDNSNKLSLLPIYSNFDSNRNSLSQLKVMPNDHLIIDYLYSLPTTTKLNIIVSDHKNNRLVVDYTIYKNTNKSKLQKESQ